MAKLVFILGRSGTGKSASIKEFNPSETVLVNADANPYPFKGFEKNYNKANKNYIETSHTPTILAVLKSLNDRPEVKRAVIDTWSRTMTDFVMSPDFRKKLGHDKWADLSGGQYDLFRIINNELRKDLIVYLMAHTETYFNDVGLLCEKVAVQGKQLEKFWPESFSSIVLYTEVKSAPGMDPEFYFRTKNSGADTCKTPIGMFEDALVPNDLNYVEKIIRQYYEET